MTSCPPSPSHLLAHYTKACSTPSDIHEHLPTLARLASHCSSVAELGVRDVVSSWALAYGLSSGSSEICASSATPRRLVLNDLVRVDVSEFSRVCGDHGVDVTAVWGNDLEWELGEGERFDLIFIDTWHVYAQLRRELAKFAPHASHFLVLHDTTVDAKLGESVRCGLDVRRQSRESGYSVDEICRGLWPAVTEFLAAHRDEWKLLRRWHNNNGLTVLQRRSSPIEVRFDGEGSGGNGGEVGSVEQTGSGGLDCPSPCGLGQSGERHRPTGSASFQQFRRFLSAFPSPDWTVHPPHSLAALEMVIVVSTEHPDLAGVLANANYMLPGAALTVIHSKENAAFVDRLFGGSTFPGVRRIVNLPATFDWREYSRLLLSPEFWEQLICSRVLIFQTDSAILHNTVLDFLHCRYVGAPWSFDAAPPTNLNVGNGGFSLRDPKLMARITRRSSYVAEKRDEESEDLAFCRAMWRSSKRHTYLAPRELAARFSSETILSPGCMGLHKPWLHHPEHAVAALLAEGDGRSAEPKAKADRGSKPAAGGGNWQDMTISVGSVDGADELVLSEGERTRLRAWVNLGIGPRGFYCGPGAHVPLPPSRSPITPAVEMRIGWGDHSRPLTLTLLWEAAHSSTSNSEPHWHAMLGSIEGRMERAVVRDMVAHPEIGYLFINPEPAALSSTSTNSTTTAPLHAAIGEKPSLDPTIRPDTWRRVVQFIPPRAGGSSSPMTPSTSAALWHEMIGAFAERHPAWGGEFFFGSSAPGVSLSLPVWRG